MILFFHLSSPTSIKLTLLCYWSFPQSLKNVTKDSSRIFIKNFWRKSCVDSFKNCSGNSYRQIPLENISWIFRHSPLGDLKKITDITSETLLQRGLQELLHGLFKKLRHNLPQWWSTSLWSRPTDTCFYRNKTARKFCKNVIIKLNMNTKRISCKNFIGKYFKGFVLKFLEGFY